MEVVRALSPILELWLFVSSVLINHVCVADSAFFKLAIAASCLMQRLSCINDAADASNVKHLQSAQEAGQNFVIGKPLPSTDEMERKCV